MNEAYYQYLTYEQALKLSLRDIIPPLKGTLKTRAIVPTAEMSNSAKNVEWYSSWLHMLNTYCMLKYFDDPKILFTFLRSRGKLLFLEWITCLLEMRASF